MTFDELQETLFSTDTEAPNENEENSNPGTRGEEKKKIFWNNDATDKLLDLVGKNIERLTSDVVRKADLWEMFSKKLQNDIPGITPHIVYKKYQNMRYYVQTYLQGHGKSCRKEPLGYRVFSEILRSHNPELFTNIDSKSELEKLRLSLSCKGSIRAVEEDKEEDSSSEADDSSDETQPQKKRKMDDEEVMSLFQEISSTTRKGNDVLEEFYSNQKEFQKELLKQQEKIAASLEVKNTLLLKLLKNM